MSFSRRLGLVPEKQIQIDYVDSALKNKLFNFFKRELDCFDQPIPMCSNILNELGEAVAYNKYDQKVLLERFLNDGLKYPWYDIYDILEFFVFEIRLIPNNHFPSYYDTTDCSGVIDRDRYLSFFSYSLNRILEDEKSGYRLVNYKFVPITSNEGIESVMQAITNPFDSVHTHMQKALSLYSDRQHPDYENSIKESISAVEAICNIITGKKTTLNNAIKLLKEKDISIHKALEDAFIKLYAYTSDAGGIRHGSIDFTNATSEDALYMLISCSAFVNYLTAKYEQIQE